MATRILVLGTYLQRTQAGAAHSTIDIINALAGAPWASVTAFGYSRDDDALLPSVPFVRGVARPHPRFLWRLPPLYEVPWAVRELAAAGLPPADVVYTQNMVLGLAYRRLVPDTPIVSHLGHVLAGRELLEESAATSLQLRANARLLDRRERRVYRTPRWRQAVSTRLLARARARHFGLPEEFFEVHPLGVDPRRFDRRADLPDVRQALGIGADEFVVVTVARLVALKNLGLLLRAVAGAGRPMRLLVVGDGPEAGRLESEAAALGIAGRVHFAGHAHPAPYLAASDVFALPSLIESFGMVYAEAMHFGLPCIGLRNDPPHVLSSAEEVIPEGVAGYCVSTLEELRDRLERLAADRPLRERMGEAGYRLATTEYSVQSYVAFLRALLEREGWT
jgi:glycosyltransferase involved in cell wall biosynthesis